MKRREQLKELEGLSGEALTIKARELAEEQMKLRFRLSSGQLEQSHRVKEVRRNLARVLTRLSDVTRTKNPEAGKTLAKGAAN